MGVVTRTRVLKISCDICPATTMDDAPGWLTRDDMDLCPSCARRERSSGRRYKPNQALVEEVARYFGTTVTAMRGSTRPHHLVSARWVAAFLLRRQGLSLPQIGRILGRNHTTIIHGLQSIAKRPDLLRVADVISGDARPDPNWRDRGRCAEADPELFFPHASGQKATEAKRICRSCPVQPECLAFAFRTNQRGGIWGGLNEKERNQIRRGRRELVSA